MRTSRRGYRPPYIPAGELTPAALQALSDQAARWSGWPDAATRLEALRDLESIGDAYVVSRLRHGLAVESAEAVRRVILDALLEQARTTPGPREIPGRVIELARDAARRSYERAERLVQIARERAAASDSSLTLAELEEQILAELRNTAAAAREARAAVGAIAAGEVGS